MTEPRQPFAQPMAWWGAIQGSVRARATTAQVWQAIRDYGVANNLAYPPGMFAAVNGLRSMATSLRASSEQLHRAPIDAVITGAMIGRLPYARGATSQALLREFHVRVGYEAIGALGKQPGYITLPYTGNLPTTVGDLYGDAATVLDSLSIGYGVEVVGELTLELGEW